MFRIEVTEKKHTFYVHYFPPSPPRNPENCTVYEIMWKIMVESDRPQVTI